MNNTNRALNRILVLVTGVILLAIGGAAILLGAVDSVRNAWADAAPGVVTQVEGAFGATLLGADAVSWIYLAIVVVAVVAIALLLSFIFRQGHGHTGELVRREATDAPGGVFVGAAVAERSLQQALSTRPELVSASVSTYKVKGTPVLKISAIARRGISPRTVSEIVDENLRALDRLLGAEIPALLHLGGGIRTRTARATRVE